MTVTLADDIFSSVKTSLRVKMIAAPLIPILLGKSLYFLQIHFKSFPMPFHNFR